MLVAAGSDAHSGADLVLPDAAAFEILAADDHRAAVKVQEHIGRLPVAFYDANKTRRAGFADHERRRGHAESGRHGAGGFRRRNHDRDSGAGLTGANEPLDDRGARAYFFSYFALSLRYAFQTIRPIYRARPKINAEVTGRLTESLGGVRVVKGYHAEEREGKVFQAGVQKLLDNVLRNAERNLSDERCRPRC